ncbi:tryptophan--tRNA ligase [Patescibacteria group bacterium]
MSAKISSLVQLEYQDKLLLGKTIQGYYQKKQQDLGLVDFSRVATYLEAALPEVGVAVRRRVIFAHLEFVPLLKNIACGKSFTIVSGLNPSSSLHLGHKVLFDLLLFFQKIGATIFIPLTNDESYLDGKVKSLKESRRLALEKIVPEIIAFGFDPKKTEIFIDSDYPAIYNLAIGIAREITFQRVREIFGEEALDNAGKIFYRSAVQLAQILLPQMSEFGGPKPILIPVGIDQHPYILLARDVARKKKLVPPVEVVFKFLPSLKDPAAKMSGSKPETAIYLDDAPGEIRRKVGQAVTGSVSQLAVHQSLGAIPEACSVFSLLYFHCEDDEMVNQIGRDYRQGNLSATELKKIVADFVVKMVGKHQQKKRLVTQKQINKFILKKRPGLFS